MEALFDDLCQKVNSILVKMLVKAGCKKFETNQNQKKKVVYQYEIWKFLSTPNLNGLMDVSISGIGDRFGGIAIIQILANLLEQKLWNGVLDHANNLRKEDDKPLDYSNVNKNFGWTVFSLIKAKQVERYRYDSELNRHLELSVEIDFMKKMRMYKSDAALSDLYLKNCYHSTMRTFDRGRITLMKEDFFEFGYKLLDIISSVATEEKIMARRGVLKIAKSNLLEDKNLWNMFLKPTSQIKVDGIIKEKKENFSVIN